MRTKLMSVVAAVAAVMMLGAGYAKALNSDPASAPTNVVVKVLYIVRSAEPGGSAMASVKITWKDNCSYESGYSIAFKSSSGVESFIKSLPANSTSTTVFLPVVNTILGARVPGSLGVKANPNIAFSGWTDVDGH